VAQSPTGIIPEEYMSGRYTAQVMDFLERLQVDGATKHELLLGWAQEVGVKISASQISAVRETGTDALGPKV
jgi:hypothetical protein